MEISVTFLPDQVTVSAQPGEMLLTVADRAGVAIPTGCLMGSCHACEVDLAAQPLPSPDRPDPSAAPDSSEDSQTVCACISAVPTGISALTVNLGIDPTW
jgi:ferredoxin